MVMIFANEHVLNYLLEHGIVYSYRKYHKKTINGVRLQTGNDWATDRRTGRKIADINITPVLAVGSLDLELGLKKYYKQSGFQSVAQWAKAIEELNPSALVGGWIYKVTVRETEDIGG